MLHVYHRGPSLFCVIRPVRSIEGMYVATSAADSRVPGRYLQNINSRRTWHTELHYRNALHIRSAWQ